HPGWVVVGLDNFDMHRRHVAIARYEVIVKIRLLHRAISDADAFSERQPDAVDDATLRLCDHIVRLHRRTAINGAPDIVDSDFTPIAIDRDFNNRSNLCTRIIDVGSAKTMSVALLAPIRHLSGTLHHLTSARRF